MWTTIHINTFRNFCGATFDFLRSIFDCGRKLCFVLENQEKEISAFPILLLNFLNPRCFFYLDVCSVTGHENLNFWNRIGFSVSFQEKSKMRKTISFVVRNSQSLLLNLPQCWKLISSLGRNLENEQLHALLFTQRNLTLIHLYYRPQISKFQIGCVIEYSRFSNICVSVLKEFDIVPAVESYCHTSCI